MARKLSGMCVCMYVMFVCLCVRICVCVNACLLYITLYPFSVELWQSFLTTAAVDQVMSLLQQGDYSKAAYIWTASLVSHTVCTAYKRRSAAYKVMPSTIRIMCISTQNTLYILNLYHNII